MSRFAFSPTAAALAGLLSSLLLAPVAQACEGLQAKDAFIPEAPPGLPMAGYVSLHNAGTQALTIDGARSPDFGAVELHRTVYQDGNARMLRDQKLPIAPGADGAFARGSYHLMLFRPQKPLKAGDTVTIDLKCGNAATPVQFSVKPAN